MSRFVVTLIFALIIVLINGSLAAPRQVKTLRYSDTLSPFAPHAFYRFYNSRQFAPNNMSKRNNAEVVNHILKNFGTLDRLGDVGK